MPVFQPTYRDPKTGDQKKAAVWWYDFTFGGKRIREPAKTKLKTLARMAEQKRRRELEEGFNGLADKRGERIRTVKELADAYLAEYKLRHKSVTFAEYALGNVTRFLGEQMAVEVAEKTVKAYQSDRLKEKAAPNINEPEIGHGQTGWQGIHCRRETAAPDRSQGRTVPRDLSRPYAGVTCWDARRGNPHDDVGPTGSIESVRYSWRQ
jgi:hypothetical protein